MKHSHFYTPNDSTVTSAQANVAYQTVLQHIEMNSPDVRVTDASRYKRRYTMRLSLSNSLCAQLSLPPGTLCEIDGVRGKRMAFKFFAFEDTKH